MRRLGHAGSGSRVPALPLALKVACLVLVLAVAASLLTTVDSRVAGTASAATAASVYWGAYVQGAPADPSLIDAFEAHAGKRASLEMIGVSWMRNGAYSPFPQADAQTMRNRGTIPVIDWFSWDIAGDATTQPAFQLADIYNGNHDAYITQFARSAAAWGHPFFFRFDPEMNGWWLPWNEQTNGNQPGDFARAWRHVVDIFRREGATNATWVFCPNIIGPLSTPLEGLYPGDDDVDWMCLDGYNWGTDKGNTGWWSFTEVFSGDEYNGGFDSYLMVQNLAPTKPIMIGETASSQNGGSKADWITSMLSMELPRYFPNVKALVWFNWNTGDPGVTWPIESSATAQAAFAAAIASPYYAANEFGALAGGAIQPLSPIVSKPTLLTSVADTCARKSLPGSVACGTSSTILSDQTGTDTAFVRFNLSGIAGRTVLSAKLRLRKSTESWASSITPHNVELVQDNTWQEASLSYNNAPAVSTMLGSFKAPSTSTWFQVPLPIDVVQARAGGLISMAVQGQYSDLLIVYAREAGVDYAPQLVLILAPPPVVAPTPTPTPVGSTLRINAGGAAYNGTDGRVWQADNGFTGGRTAATAAPILGATDQALYQTERYGNFSYSLPVSNGSYAVTLKFAELYWSTAGQRVFNVSINGQPVLTNFDILATVGSKTAALDRTFTTTVSGGTLTIVFTTVVDNAKVDAIEIVPSTANTSVFRVNAGGPAYTAADGRVWQADNGFTGGRTAATAAPILGATDQALYQTERYGNFSYSLPVSNGSYAVTLKFAELYWSTAGQRVFNVSINGQPVLTNFDILATVGSKNAALDRTFTTTVSGGTLTIVFTTIVDNAKVDAIAVATSP